MASVWVAARRLALGVTLIALASAVLLYSDRSRRASEAAPAVRRWKIDFIQYSQTTDVEECEQGVRDGLRASGLVEGRDYDVGVRNAQGDMATVSALVDAAVVERADLIVTFSTPTLQAALGRARGVPVVFTYVASPVAAGAGSSDTDHPPTVTGVYMEPAYEPMLDVIRRVQPRVQSIGTLFVPSESNSVYMHERLREACRKAGLRLESMPANTSSDVGDASLALASRQPDVICQIPGNLTATAFPTILHAADAARVPIFAFQGSQGRAGAIVTLSRDYHEAGRMSGVLASKIVRGASPAALPYEPLTANHVIVNLDAARRLGIVIPPDVLAQAAEVVGH
jgi:putative ABC transport system substrate-binding protein